MFQNFLLELIPRAAGNGYRNTQIALLERKYLTVDCKTHAVQ
jgi:hypothetical protein